MGILIKLLALLNSWWKSDAFKHDLNPQREKFKKKIKEKKEEKNAKK